MDHKDSSIVPIVHQSLLAPGRPTRLISRGLSVLGSMVMRRLLVEDLLVDASMVFVLTPEWDVDAVSRYRALPEWQLHKGMFWENRFLRLYQFNLDGSYSGKVRLALLEFSESGYKSIYDRAPGELSLYDGRFHFWEWIELKQDHQRMRIDYLFLTSGERLAIWSSSSLVHDLTATSEPKVPVDNAMSPDWIAGKYAVRAISELLYRASSGELVDSSPRQHVWWCEVTDFINAYSHGVDLDQVRSNGPNWVSLDFPLEERRIFDYLKSWLSAFPRNDTVWYLGFDFPRCIWTVWTLDLNDGIPKVGVVSQEKVADVLDLIDVSIWSKDYSPIEFRQRPDNWLSKAIQTVRLVGVEHDRAMIEIVLSSPEILEGFERVLVMVDGSAEDGQRIRSIDPLKPLDFMAAIQAPRPGYAWAFSEGQLITEVEGSGYEDSIVVFELDAGIRSLFALEVPEQDLKL